MKDSKPIVAVILAAGKGKRMKSDLPKVLHKLGGKPMVEYVVETAKRVGVEKIILVVGHKRDKTQKLLKHLDVEFVIQEEQLGTGHAVMQAKDHLTNFDGDVLILCGDMPLLKSDTVRRLLEEHRRKKAVTTVLTAILEDPSGYGRIIRDEKGMVQKIVEEGDASADEKKVKEINTGTFCFDSKSLFSVLDKITPDNKQGEYYLTDALEFLRKKNLPIWAVVVSNPQEGLGINSQEELERMEEILLVENPAKGGAESSGQTTLLS
ncbi:MAG: NTP transferase domain-containing protein [candidate division Zixibacteria bacterium]|nr:NTP transferase domain-containing protein [candidate division Zixibacteria bacterium]